MARPILITVKGQFSRIDGTPETGIVEFQSNGYTLYSSGSAVIVPSRISAVLDSQGNLEIQVPATNDPAWAPSGWTYTLILRLSNDYSIYEVSVPYDADNGEVTLAELISVQDNLPVSPANYAPLVHNHAAADIVTGVIASTRLPIGTTAGTVAAGDHTHAGGGSGGGPIAIADVTGLVDALNAKANTSGLSTVASSGSYNDLLNKPVIPTVTVTSVAGRQGAVTLTKADVGLSNVDNTSDANKPVSTATQTALNGKANTSHTHAQSDITGLVTTLDGFVTPDDLANVALTGSYNDLTDKPTIPTVPVTSVSGRTGDVTLSKSDVGLANVDNTSDANKPVSSATQTALNGKANTSHTHTIANVTDLQTTLDSKANTSHTHAIGDVTGLQTALDGKQPTGSYATASDVTALDGRVDALEAMTPTIRVWNGTTYEESSTAVFFVGPDQPTGTIPEGSIWIDTDA